MSEMIATGTIRNLLYQPNPPATLTLQAFKFDAANFAATTRFHGLYDSTDTDLSPFAQAGGRLILWHGLADPHISPLNTVAYFEGLRHVMGAQRVEDFARLYLFPGGAHCGGGEGPFDFDLVSAMLSWVEQGKSPSALVASHTAGPQGPPAGVPDGPPRPGAHLPPPPARAQSTVDRTRPVYPYPQVAVYVGHGSSDAAANFKAADAQRWPVNNTWYGAKFFDTHQSLWCAGETNGLRCRESP